MTLKNSLNMEVPISKSNQPQKLIEHWLSFVGQSPQVGFDIGLKDLNVIRYDLWSPRQNPRINEL